MAEGFPRSCPSRPMASNCIARTPPRATGHFLRQMALDPQPSTLDPRLSTLGPQPSTLDPQHSPPATLESQPTPLPMAPLIVEIESLTKVYESKLRVVAVDGI